MVVVKIGDGLGNQIYNYVMGYAVARYNGEKLCLDISDAENNPIRSYMLNSFNLDEHSIEYFGNKTFFQKVYKRLRREIKYHTIFEKGYSSFESNKYIFDKKSVRALYLHGYWQSIKFFEMYETEIRRQLTANYPMKSHTKECIEYLKNENTCAIHLRGGDIAMPENSYFIKAVNYIKDKISDLKFIVFTNDYDKAKERLNSLNINFKLIEDFGEFTDLDSFFLLSSCQNQIVSESTYSIWAAVLNDNKKKIVIAPVNEREHERCPDSWIFL